MSINLFPIADWAGEFYSDEGLPIKINSYDFDSFYEIAKRYANGFTKMLEAGVDGYHAQAAYLIDEQAAKKALIESGLNKKYPNFRPVENWKFIVR